MAGLYVIIAGAGKVVHPVQDPATVADERAPVPHGHPHAATPAGNAEANGSGR